MTTTRAALRKETRWELDDSADLGLLGVGCPQGLYRCGVRDKIAEQWSRERVFVAIPYSHYDYENTILGNLRGRGLTPVLAKDVLLSRLMLCKICERMRTTAFAVVDVTAQNANVMLELGVLLTLRKRCAILFEKHGKRTTDLQGMENVMYEDENTLTAELMRWLDSNLPEIQHPTL